ncbi:MAG TPA: RsmE family RNA methyltransferase [Spirochaetia bacterium]|nr:RsmE family RNA methyltransferase [Spirochaetia bacterium]
MKQFVLPKWYAGQARISLSGDDYLHLARVLRLREGTELPAVDVRGVRYTMTLAQISRSGCDVELAPAVSPRDISSFPSLTLLQCLPKGRKIDLIIRQATEAGVSRIALIESERSIARASEDENRMERLLKIAREAVQQSGIARLPLIDAPRPLASLGDTAGQWGTALVFHEQRVADGTLHDLLAGRPERVSILIGPEGGLAPSEIDLLTGAGFRAAHLGGAVLRVETAAIYAIAAVQTILRERDAWRAAQKR